MAYVPDVTARWKRRALEISDAIGDTITVNGTVSITNGSTVELGANPIAALATAIDDKLRLSSIPISIADSVNIKTDTGEHVALANGTIVDLSTAIDTKLRNTSLPTVSSSNPLLRGFISAVSGSSGNVVTITKDDGSVDTNVTLPIKQKLQVVNTMTEPEAQAASFDGVYPDHRTGQSTTLNPLYYDAGTTNVFYYNTANNVFAYNNGVSTSQLTGFPSNYYQYGQPNQAWVVHTAVSPNAFTFLGWRQTGSLLVTEPYSLGTECVKAGSQWIIKPALEVGNVTLAPGTTINVPAPASGLSAVQMTAAVEAALNNATSIDVNVEKLGTYALEFQSGNETSNGATLPVAYPRVVISGADREIINRDYGY